MDNFIIFAAEFVCLNGAHWEGTPNPLIHNTIVKQKEKLGS